MNKSINELVQEAHENAKAKGWWDEERTFGEIGALIHSEVSEALEDCRNGHEPAEVWYETKNYDGVIVRFEEQRYPDWKPCGIPSELADICIRVFDVCGWYGWGETLERWCGSAKPEAGCEVQEKSPFAENLNIIHGNLVDCFRSESWRPFKFAIVVQNVEKLARFYGIDLEQAIAEKMAYNTTRPIRHGGKKL
ncbi:hypothetical protein [Paenibacillus cineris]|uniref:Uncharacterized protein n=1 Tax=Paenibacillus cineris TaxID=237530 RepID=A0ABQ4LNB9_9BACL|nr:hypothetical protein [Paenibacillus cineris]GIO57977.1 hypothetical protein J21TS7_62950 [Paenibacillus cineris]